MKEEEAKEKWCPMYRVAVEEHGSADNRGNTDEVFHHRCLASGCMMWRWDTTHSSSGKVASDEGHCGLAAVTL